MSVDAIIEELAEKYNSDTGSILFARYADALLQAERTEEAMDICRQGIQAYPYYITGYIVLGRCCITAGSPDEAASQFDSALRLDGRCTSALKLLGTLCLDKEDYAGAAEKFGTILDIDPFNTEVERLRQQAAAKAGSTVPAAGVPEADDTADGNISDILDDFDDTDLDEIDSETESGDKDDASGADGNDTAGDDVMGALGAFDSETALEDDAPSAEVETEAPEEAAEADLAGDDILGALDALDTGEVLEEEAPSAEVETEAPEEAAEADLAGDDILGALDALDTEGVPEEKIPAAEMDIESFDESDLAGDDIMGALDALDNEYSAGEPGSHEGISAELDLDVSTKPDGISVEDEDAGLDGDDVMGALDALDLEQIPEEDELPSGMEAEPAEAGEVEDDLSGDDMADALGMLDVGDSDADEGEDDTGLSGSDVEAAFDILDVGDDSPDRSDVDETAETVILTRSDLEAMKGDEMRRPETAARKPVFDGTLEDEEATVALTNLDLGEEDDGLDADDSAEEDSPPVKTDPLNVATVTLAEIYFKQGLKEQAIDIYRQLLEREPDNQQIAHRIEFIKASRVETTDVPIVSRDRRRRPRPGGSASS